MIFTKLGLILNTILVWMIGLFPNASTSNLTTFNSWMGGFRTLITGASFLFPVNLMFFLIGFIIVIEFSLFSYRLVKLIVGYISGGFLRD